MIIQKNINFYEKQMVANFKTKKCLKQLIFYNEIKTCIEISGNQLISNFFQYKNKQTKFKIKCPNNHIFLCKVNKLDKSQICPKCK